MSVRVYLDYAASAPLSPEVKSAIAQFDCDFLVGNPSSGHAEGRKAQALLDRATTTVAAVFGVEPTEVIFTSGATESNNVLIQGVLKQWRLDHPNQKLHIVMSAIEHASWREIAQAENADVTVIPVTKNGV